MGVAIALQRPLSASQALEQIFNLVTQKRPHRLRLDPRSNSKRGHTMFRSASSTETASTANADTPLARRPRRQRRRAAAVLATVGVSTGVLLAVAPSAFATSISSYPSFSCAASGSGGVIRGSSLHVNDDGKTTAYYVEVDRWNSSTGSWYAYGVLRDGMGGYVESLTDSVVGQLNQPTLSAGVAHGYYRVWYWMRSSGDTSNQYSSGVDVSAPAHYYTSSICAV